MSGGDFHLSNQVCFGPTRAGFSRALEFLHFRANFPILTGVMLPKGLGHCNEASPEGTAQPVARHVSAGWAFVHEASPEGTAQTPTRLGFHAKPTFSVASSARGWHEPAGMWGTPPCRGGRKSQTGAACGGRRVFAACARQAVAFNLSFPQL
jgi:hypothetical protein